jgi:hypothetical protein
VAIEKDFPFEPHDPIVLAAFEGWNDAANAATSAVDHLIDVFDAVLVGEIDPDEYYDFQVNRPVVGFVGDPDEAPEPAADSRADDEPDGGPAAPARSITWPTTRFYLARPPEGDHDLLLVRGIEPNMRWRAFTAELLAMADDAGAVLWVVLGALLADVPHTRPIPVNGHSSDPAWSFERDLEPTRYEGPTGINGVIGDACNRLGIAEVSFWAAVPHYVSQPPCPKATLALLRSVEDTLGLSIPLADLPETARAWERGVAELAANDEEVAEYVRALEDARDTTELPQASGEAIAAEFESYLRRRERRRGVRGDKPEDD